MQKMQNSSFVTDNVSLSLVTHIMLKIAFPASTWWILRKIKDVLLLLSLDPLSSLLLSFTIGTHHGMYLSP